MKCRLPTYRRVVELATADTEEDEPDACFEAMAESGHETGESEGRRVRWWVRFKQVELTRIAVCQPAITCPHHH